MDERDEDGSEWSHCFISAESINDIPISSVAVLPSSESNAVRNKLPGGSFRKELLNSNKIVSSGSLGIANSASIVTFNSFQPSANSEMFQEQSVFEQLEQASTRMPDSFTGLPDQQIELGDASNSSMMQTSTRVPDSLTGLPHEQMELRNSSNTDMGQAPRHVPDSFTGLSNQQMEFRDANSNDIADINSLQATPMILSMQSPVNEATSPPSFGTPELVKRVKPERVSKTESSNDLLEVPDQFINSKAEEAHQVAANPISEFNLDNRREAQAVPERLPELVNVESNSQLSSQHSFRNGSSTQVSCSEMIDFMGNVIPSQAASTEPSHMTESAPVDAGDGASEQNSTQQDNHHDSQFSGGFNPDEIWCEDCQRTYIRECPKHRLQQIADKVVLPRAWASIPTNLQVLSITDNGDADRVYGVFTKKHIAKRTQFGPFQAERVADKNVLSQSVFLLQVTVYDGLDSDSGRSYFLDYSDENTSNWMRFVRPAITQRDQNLIAYQHGNDIYYVSIRAIEPKEELKVWYAAHYANRLGLPLLEPGSPDLQKIKKEEERQKREQERQEKVDRLKSKRSPRKSLDMVEEWPCFECTARFSSSQELQDHLNVHDDVEQVEDEDDQPYISSIKRRRGRPPKKFHYVEQGQEDSEEMNKEPGFTDLLEGIPVPLKKRKAGRVGIRHSSRKRSRYTVTRRKTFKCELCQKIFPRAYSLQRHMLMHTGEKKHQCNLCPMKFSHQYNLKKDKHGEAGELLSSDLSLAAEPASLYKQQDTEEGGNEWVCMHCGLTFNNSNVLNLHTLTHAAEDVSMQESGEGTNFFETQNQSDDAGEIFLDNLFQCPACTQIFTSKKDLIEHASVHAKQGRIRIPSLQTKFNTAKPFKCTMCYKSFSTAERLERHSAVHGDEEAKPLQCEICYKRFLNNSALACHQKIHNEVRTYDCPLCQEKFLQVNMLKDHLPDHLENGYYHCPHCQKPFSEYVMIRKHVRAFHSTRSYPCRECEKVFPRPDKLKLHMLRHSDHREFLCALCGKQFKRKDKLKEHIKRMHNPDREAKLITRPPRKPGATRKFIPKVSPTDYHRFIYKCHTCLLGFKRRGMLVNHLAKRHPDIPPDSIPELNLPILKTQRDYYCQYCEKVYKSSSKRKSHILKNHPGAELPPSTRRPKLVRKEGEAVDPLAVAAAAVAGQVPGMDPNLLVQDEQGGLQTGETAEQRQDQQVLDSYSQTVCSVTTTPHCCQFCYKQYANKQKLMMHQRKKHADLVPPAQHRIVTSQRQPPPAHTSHTDVIEIPLLPDNKGIVTIQRMPGRQMQYLTQAVPQERLERIDIPVSAEGVPAADLLTQAMSELSQTLGDYRAPPSEYQALTERWVHHRDQCASSPRLATPMMANQATTIDLSQLQQNLTLHYQPHPGQMQVTQIPQHHVVTQVQTQANHMSPAPSPVPGQAHPTIAHHPYTPRSWTPRFSGYLG